MSSIHNMSKHSFEELDKNGDSSHINQNLLKASPQTNPQLVENNFFFISSNQPSQQTHQQQPIQQLSLSGKNEQDKGYKDISEENFEEITESKEIIEDRVNRIKLIMIDFTMKQQDLSEKTKSLEKDIELLQLKLEDTANQQQRAIEKEDYDEADALNIRITQTKNLIMSKENQIKRLDEDYMTLENKKGDKYKELSVLIHKSLTKMA